MKDKIVSDQNICTLEKWNQYYLYKEKYLKNCKEKIIVIRESILNKENKLESEIHEKLKIINESLRSNRKEIEQSILNAEKTQLQECSELKKSIANLENKYELLLGDILKDCSNIGI